MKVGGNQKASDYFKQHGGWKDDAKQRYTSRAATSYREKLQQWAEEDTRQFPDYFMALEEKEPVAAPVEDDFFAAFEKPAAPAVVPVVVAAPKVTPRATTTITANKTRSTLTTRKPAASKLGAKKATTAVDFAQAEARAKKKQEEEEARKQGEQDDYDTQIKVEQEAQEKRESLLRKVSTPSKPTVVKAEPKHLSKQDEELMERLGMGMGRMNLAAAAKPASPVRKQVAVGDDARNRFGGAKSISSDQYFGRGEEDPSIREERSAKMKQFEGARSISSADYFGRNEEEDATAALPDVSFDFGGIEMTAKDFAKRFADQASSDYGAFKNALFQGGSKLSDYLADVQVSLLWGMMCVEPLCEWIKLSFHERQCTSVRLAAPTQSRLPAPPAGLPLSTAHAQNSTQRCVQDTAGADCVRVILAHHVPPFAHVCHGA
jgi:ADP-ribosylation factor GTPase-activating protein 2/3